MVKRIIDNYLAEVENGRIVVPNYGAYIKRNGCEKVFVDLFRADDGVLEGLIIDEINCDKTQAQILIAEFIDSQNKKSVPSKQTQQIQEPQVESAQIAKQEDNNKSDTTVKRQEMEAVFSTLPHKKRRKLDPVIVLALVAIGCVIALVVITYIKNGGESLGL